MNNYNNIALVIVSCDKYSDLWEPYIYFFKKHWQDCSFDKYFLTNHLESPDPDFKALKVYEDVSWSDNLTRAINMLDVNYEYVMLFLEDLILSEKVNNLLLNFTIEDFIKRNGNYIKLIKNQNATKKTSSYLSEIPKESLYRTTSVFALWKKETLLKLLKPGENAWEFERNGSIRSDSYFGFYICNNSIFNHKHLVIKGKLLLDAKRWICKNGYTKPIERDKFSYKDFIKYKTYKILRTIFWGFIPLKHSRKVYNHLSNA
ncbi:MAG: hypothetical protein HC905_22240 [Bacteroidales bacterium]|nr:hypothetical protein [Bacteroidales bacterium]